MIETKFNQTEIGLIPEEWEVDCIGEICKIGTGSRNTQDKKDNGIYPFYVRSEQIERIDTFSYDCEAVLTAGDGVGTGKVFHYVNGKFELHQRVYMISEFADNLCAKYFYWYFSNKFYDRVSSMTAKSSVDSVRKEMIEDMTIPLPPIQEQQRIATALSDIDALISALNKKIEKKKLIKQGAMQQLLTGKKRLQGFSEPWQMITIGECFDVFDGTHQTPLYVDNGIPFYSVENVMANNFTHTRYISFNEHQSLTTKRKMAKGDVLMTRIGTIGVCKYIDWSVDASYYVSLSLLKAKGKVDALFFSFASTTKHFKDSLALHSLIYAIPQKINLHEILKVSFIYPTNVKEQCAIATILSDMDKEIAVLDAKRTKYERIKQGMMQQLLTGKIRLTD